MFIVTKVILPEEIRQMSTQEILTLSDSMVCEEREVPGNQKCLRQMVKELAARLEGSCKTS